MLDFHESDSQLSLTSRIFFTIRCCILRKLSKKSSNIVYTFLGSFNLSKFYLKREIHLILLSFVVIS